MKTKTTRTLNLSTLAFAAFTAFTAAAPTLIRDTPSALLGMVQVVEGANDNARPHSLIKSSDLPAGWDADSRHDTAERLISDVVVVSRDADHVRP